jgi:immunoglobulin-binding protein 1
VRAKLYFNSNDDRMRSIEVAKKLFLSYLGLCEHYELLPAVIKPILEKLNKENYKPSREEKVQMYRASKIAEDEATNLDAKWKQGSKNKRDAFKSLMIFKCFGAETDVEMIPQEMEMLKFRNKLETDTEFKKQYDAEMAKPRPKPYFYKLDDTKGNIPDPNDPKNQVRTADLKAQGGPHGHICGPCAKTKLDVMDTLWQPDHAQPNMTMEEHADLEIKLMHEKMEREKAHQAAEDEKMNRLTEHEKDDLQTLKDRAWDDWKDANEKGAGNKKR